METIGRVFGVRAYRGLEGLRVEGFWCLRYGLLPVTLWRVQGLGVRLGAAGSGLLSRAAGLGIEGLEIRVDGLVLIDSMSHNVVN